MHHFADNVRTIRTICHDRRQGRTVCNARTLQQSQANASYCGICRTAEQLGRLGRTNTSNYTTCSPIIPNPGMDVHKFFSCATKLILGSSMLRMHHTVLQHLIPNRIENSKYQCYIHQNHNFTDPPKPSSYTSVLGCIETAAMHQRKENTCQGCTTTSWPQSPNLRNP